MLVLSLLLCGSCSPPERVISHVILFNELGSSVFVAKDWDAMKVALMFIARGNVADRAQYNALEVEGRVFEVANGTRADVLQEGTDIVKDIRPLYVRLTTGPHAGEKVVCMKNVTRPDE